MPRPTITDVARAAGVSKGAVSFALNDRPGLAPDTRQRILDVAARPRLDPEPAGPGAVGLQGARRGARRRPAAGDPPGRPVLPLLHRRARDGALRARARAAAAWSPSTATMAGYRRLGEGGSRRRRLRHRPRRSTTRGPRCSSRARPAAPWSSARPCADDADRRRRRCRRRSPASGPPSSTSSSSGTPAHRARRRTPVDRARPDPAYRLGSRRCARPGCPRAICVEADFSAASGAAATRDLLDLAEPPDRDRLRQRPDGDGRAVAAPCPAGSASPGDLSVTGFDDTEIAAHLQPSLTTVSTDVVTWGGAAATRLLELIHGQEPTPVTLPPARLVVRASTGPAST